MGAPPKNMKQTWKEIKLIISLKTDESESPKTINSKGEFLTQSNSHCQQLSNFFCFVEPNIQSTINSLAHILFSTKD